MIRDLSMNCGNKVRLEMEGQDSDLDKSLITAIQDPLMNIIRNAIVHGIETPEERRNLGKPEEGVIRLRAFNQSGQIHIEVQDDGRGVNFQAVKTQVVNESCEKILQTVLRPFGAPSRGVNEPGGLVSPTLSGDRFAKRDALGRLVQNQGNGRGTK